MKNQRIIWSLVVIVIIAVFVIFNYQGNKDFIPLSAIFPEKQAKEIPKVQYVFMGSQPVMNAEATKNIGLQESLEQTAQNIGVAPEKKIETVSVKDDYTSVPFTIQIASFQDKTNAESFLGKLLAAGYPGRLVRADLGTPGVRYRIYVGAFKTKSEAKEYLGKIQEKYQGSMIISLR